MGVCYGVFHSNLSNAFELFRDSADIRRHMSDLTSDLIRLIQIRDTTLISDGFL